MAVLCVLLALHLVGRSVVAAAPLSTPWLSLEKTDKDRAKAGQPWLTYESSSVITFSSTAAPLSPEAALNPANYRVDGPDGASVAIAGASYRSRLLFLALKASSTFPNPIAWGHHVSLRLATPLTQGQTYNITALAAAFGQDTMVQLLADEAAGVNENIHVNQVGYPISAPKRAIVGAWLGSTTAAPPFIHATLMLPEGNTSPFTVVDAVTGAVAFTGTAQLFGTGALHEYYKQVAWHLDFSGLQTEGRYYIRVPGLGISHTFLVSQDALRPALGALSRTVYAQRCGVALSKEYLAPWERPEACHTTDAIVMGVDPVPSWFASRLPVPTTTNTTTLPPDPVTGSYFLPQAPAGTQINAVGGHHDAGDYGKYVVNSGTFVGWLMNALEVLGADHDDLPLPEAGDGVPDIMQMVAHELQYLEGMQDADGGVYCVVKPNTAYGEYYEGHLPCGTPGKDQCNMPADDPKRGPRIAWPKDTTCTAQWAAAMARAGRSLWFKALRPADAARYTTKAVKAWEYLEAKAPFGALCYHFYGCGDLVSTRDAIKPAWEKKYNCYDPKGDHSHDERVWAAVELFAATGEEKYHSYFMDRHCPRFRKYDKHFLPASYGLATVSYAHLAQQAKEGKISLQVNETMAARCQSELAAAGKGWADWAVASPYFLSVAERDFSIYSYGWTFPTNVAMQMLVAAKLAASNATEAAHWRDMAAMQLHYVLGVNPQSYSLITGVGAKRFTNPVDQETLYDDLDAPWPGQLIGLSGGFSWINTYGSAVGKSFPPQDYAVFNRISDGWNVQTEYTVPNIAMAVGVLAALSGPVQASLPPKPNITLQQSVVSGPAPLAVIFQLSVAGDPSDVATIEYDFGDGVHSYNAQPTHTYSEAGRMYRGFVSIVDRRGQAVVQTFRVTTTAAVPSSPLGPDMPPNMQLVARLSFSEGASNNPSVPQLLVVSSKLQSGQNASLSTAVNATVQGAVMPSTQNVAWQGNTLQLSEFTDRASYSISAASVQSAQALLATASGGVVLEAWLYINKFVTYARGNANLIGILNRSKFFGLRGETWALSKLAGGDSVTIANTTQLEPSLTLGRWHHMRLSALPSGVNGTGVCSAWVDGVLVSELQSCPTAKLLDYCVSTGALSVEVGSFDGYIGDLRVYASSQPDPSNTCNTSPPAAPPPSPAPPRPPPPTNIFSPVVVNAGTIAVMDADSACGVPSSAINTSLPMKLFSNGAATNKTLLPSAVAYPDGLAVDASNVSWAAVPSGCSLHINSITKADGYNPVGYAGVKWKISLDDLKSAIFANAFSVEAKIFVEKWHVSYSAYNADVFGVVTYWDSYFKVYDGKWSPLAVMLTTRSANTSLGNFSGDLANNQAVESAISVGAWHHVVLAANATTCVFSVDGVAVASGQCEANKMFWWTGGTEVVVGGFVGWVDDIAMHAGARPSQAPNSTNYTVPLPNLPKPSPSPSLAPSIPVKRFAPVSISSATIAVVDADAACPLAGSDLAAGLPAKLYSNGVASGTLLPSTVAYPDGLAVTANNTDWAAVPSGCSLRINSITKADGYTPTGYAGVKWKVPASALKPANLANALTIEAKIFVEKWHVAYSAYPADMFGHHTYWDTYFKVHDGKWGTKPTGPATVMLTTRSVNKTAGEFSGNLATNDQIEGALSAGSWHHVTLSANASSCVVSVDGVTVVSGGCEARKFLWWSGGMEIVVGGFVGYIDEVALHAEVRTSQAPLLL